MLDNNSSNVLLSHHCGEIIVGESTIYSSALDSFDVSDHKCLIQSADLLSNWSKVKSLFLNENYSSTNILSIILNLDPQQVMGMRALDNGYIIELSIE